MKLIIAQGKNRSHDHTLTGMDTHRVDIFHSTDDDTGVIGITHDFKFDLLPSGYTLFNENLMDT